MILGMINGSRDGTWAVIFLRRKTDESSVIYLDVGRWKSKDWMICYMGIGAICGKEGNPTDLAESR